MATCHHGRPEEGRVHHRKHCGAHVAGEQQPGGLPGGRQKGSLTRGGQRLTSSEMLRTPSRVANVSMPYSLSPSTSGRSWVGEPSEPGCTWEEGGCTHLCDGNDGGEQSHEAGDEGYGRAPLLCEE